MRLPEKTCREVTPLTVVVVLGSYICGKPAAEKSPSRSAAVGDGSNGRRGRRCAQAFICEKEEGLITLDRTANTAPKLVPNQVRRRLGEKVTG